MIAYNGSNIIKKFLWESGFSNFHRDGNDAKRKLIIWLPFWNGIFSFLKWLFLEFKIMWYSPQCRQSGFLRGSMEPPPPWAPTDGKHLCHFCYNYNNVVIDLNIDPPLPQNTMSPRRSAKLWDNVFQLYIGELWWYENALYFVHYISCPTIWHSSALI